MKMSDEYDFLRVVMRHNVETQHIVSHHEAYALIKEHLDRYWHEILLRDSSVHKHTMLQELAQIAALCCRVSIDLELMQRGNGL
jgi:hypothetical protein